MKHGIIRKRNCFASSAPSSASTEVITISEHIPRHHSIAEGPTPGRVPSKRRGCCFRLVQGAPCVTNVCHSESNQVAPVDPNRPSRLHVGAVAPARFGSQFLTAGDGLQHEISHLACEIMLGVIEDTWQTIMMSKMLAGHGDSGATRELAVIRCLWTLACDDGCEHILDASCVSGERPLASCGDANGMPTAMSSSSSWHCSSLISSTPCAGLWSVPCVVVPVSSSQPPVWLKRMFSNHDHHTTLVVPMILLD